MPTFDTLLQSKDLKLGTYVGEFAVSGIGTILSQTDCDFVFLDMEHSGIGFETAKLVLNSLHAAGIASIVRPPSQARHHLARTCDIGAQGVIPPMIETAEQARECVAAIKYHPLGRRGCAFGIAHDGYRKQSVKDAIQAANQKTRFVALIESKTGVENCNKIAATEGVDCLWIGHLDLSATLGIPGDYTNPIFASAVAEITAAASDNKLSLGRVVGTPEEAAKIHQEGCDLLCYRTDVGLLQLALDEGFERIRGLVQSASKSTG